MSNYLLVELRDDLAKHMMTRNAVFRAIQHVNGVCCVTDLSVISRETLDKWLLPPEQAWACQSLEEPEPAAQQGLFE